MPPMRCRRRTSPWASDRLRGRMSSLPRPPVVPLGVVVRDELRHRAPKVTLAKQHHAMQALLFDRADESFRVGVAVRCAHRGPNDPDVPNEKSIRTRTRIGCLGSRSGMGEPPRLQAKPSGGRSAGLFSALHVRAALVGFSRRGAWNPSPSGEGGSSVSRIGTAGCALITASVLWRSQTAAQDQRCDEGVGGKESPCGADSRLRRGAIVAVVQAADFRRRHDASDRRRLDGPMHRAVLREREMRTRAHVVPDVSTRQSGPRSRRCRIGSSQPADG
jgi:hypothetical protein